MITGERDLITAAGACTVNRGNGRNLERSQAIENALAFRDEGAHFPGLACRSKVCKSAPAIKIDFLAEAMITPLSEESFSMAVT